MPLSSADWAALVLTLELASITTVLLIIICTPLAFWLAFTKSKIAAAVNALIMLPLVLPPTVIGFYLLIMMASQGILGQLWHDLGLGSLSFSFSALVIGSMVYSLPFAVQPLQRAFEAVGRGPLEEAAMLGASPLDRFWSVALPLARPGFFTAAILSFAHTVGEFGVVLMIGGNIEGQTRVVSVQIYDHVEALEYAAAHWLALILVVFSFFTLLALNWIKPAAAQ